jgi:hypothetical protein
MMNPWDNDAPWINALRIPKAAKEALWRQVQSGNITEDEAQSYNWGLFSDIANVVKTIANSRVNGVPVNELQKAYTDLETIRTRIQTNDEELAAFDDAFTASRTENIRVGNRTYSRERATELVERLRSNRKTLVDSLDKLRVRIMITRDDIQAQKDYAEGFWNRYQATKDPEDFKRYQEATGALSTQVISAVNQPGPNVRVGVGQTGVVRQPPVSARTDAMGRTGFGAGPSTTGVTAPAGMGGTGAPAAPVAVTKADVDAALASSGLPDTPQNRKDVRDQLKAGKKKVTNWEALVAEQAGEYAYLLDPKFEGVPDLLRKAVQQEWFKSEEGKAQFVQELKKTPYGLNTTKNQQGFDVKTPAEQQLSVQAQIDKIRGEYGEIQFDQATLEEVAGVAARNGASDVELGRLVYRAAFKRGSVAPDFTTPVAAKTALGGEDADRIRAIYRAYGQRPDDTQISRILAQETDPASGVVMTEDMLRNNLRDLAKVSYAPFADLLDRGVSVETIFSPYQQIASRVLEKAPDQVAFLDGNGVPTQFASALMGEKPMSLTDWITKLKSDDKYGWQFTNEAKQQASNLVMDLEKKFGFRA